MPEVNALQLSPEMIQYVSGIFPGLIAGAAYHLICGLALRYTDFKARSMSTYAKKANVSADQLDSILQHRLMKKPVEQEIRKEIDRQEEEQTPLYRFGVATTFGILFSFAATALLNTPYLPIQSAAVTSIAVGPAYRVIYEIRRAIKTLNEPEF